jgi:cysteine desulfurase family protein
MKTLYLDNAATSWPKPPAVPAAVRREIVHGGGNPGRSGHRKSIEAGRVVLACRERLAELLCVSDPSRLVFTKNATEALNIVLFGLLRGGGHVVTTGMEHNSILRPLRALEAGGVVVEEATADADGRVDAGDVVRRIRAGTRLVAVTHASNVTGAVNDIAAIGAACRNQGIPFLVDAAQTAGCVPIDLGRTPVDYLAFSGHKGLLGPQGTGGLYVGNVAGLPPLLRGGTGSLSDREEQPDFLPDRYESGTLNVPGLAGLTAGVMYLLRRGVADIALHDQRLREALLDVVSRNRRVSVFGARGSGGFTGVASVVIEGLSPSTVGERLEQQFGILTRIGLHCAPRAHRTIGTFPHGTTRLGWGPFTTERDIVRAGRALLSIAAEG